MENISIRKLEKRDAEEISRINDVITKSALKDEIRKTVEKSSERSGELSLVAEAEGKVVGYMITYLLVGGFGMKKSAWIALFGVDPKYMGEGIGKALAKEVFEFYEAKGIKDIYTSVRWDSTDLLSFFKALGFDRSNYINLRKILE